MLRVIALSVAVVVATPALADPATPAPNGAQAATPPAKEKMVCRREADTGSIMPKRVCRTPSEWNTATAGKRGIMDDMRQQQDVAQQSGMARTN